MQKNNTLWQTAAAVSAAAVLTCSALVYGQSDSSGASRSTSGGSSSRGAQGSAELHDLNQQVIQEFRANQGKVGGRYANRPLLLLTTTGAKSSQTRTNPLAYTRDGDRLVVIASF